MGQSSEARAATNQSLAESVSRQAVELFSHLPVGEVADEDPLCFKTDEAGNLEVFIARTSYAYILLGGQVWRSRWISDKELELTRWKNKRLMELVVIGPPPQGLRTITND